MNKIVVFASGSGSNAENIIKHFKNNNLTTVTHVFCNNPNAFVINRAKKLDIPVYVFNSEDFKEKNGVHGKLLSINPDLIVLAGFLWKFPKYLVSVFHNKIINIHPALLPSYGGKGMYGMHVHKAVVENKEEKSGITIHYVNEFYDEGGIIKQFDCNIEATDSPEDVANKIHKLEMTFFPKVIQNLIENNA